MVTLSVRIGKAWKGFWVTGEGGTVQTRTISQNSWTRSWADAAFGSIAQATASSVKGVAQAAGGSATVMGLADELFERLDDLVADTEVDVEFHEGATVETSVYRKSGTAFRCLIEIGHHLTDRKSEEVRHVHGSREQKPLPEPRSGVVGSSRAVANREIQVFRGSRLSESEFECVAALEHPALANSVVLVKHPGQESVECDLPSEAIQVGVLTKRAVVEPRLKSGSERAGGCVLAYGGHRSPASGSDRSSGVLSC